jgi:LPPG:FO 2-phospho-L-lactate transferase
LVVAVSPIVGGEAIKGPAAKMYRELGIVPSAPAVAQQYQSFLSSFVMDQVDQEKTKQVELLGIRAFVTDTIMKSTEDRKRLAEQVLQFCGGLLGGIGSR